VVLSQLALKPNIKIPGITRKRVNETANCYFSYTKRPSEVGKAKRTAVRQTTSNGRQPCQTTFKRAPAHSNHFQTGASPVKPPSNGRSPFKPSSNGRKPIQTTSNGRSPFNLLPTCAVSIIPLSLPTNQERFRNYAGAFLFFYSPTR
jgi:hypothetical protein